jgi:hypothetical protein
MSPDSPNLPRQQPPRRFALGLWFLGLGVLGLVRYGMKAARDADFASDTVAWLWLIGSVVVCLIGIIDIARVRRHRRDVPNE